ncbi:MAG: type IV secretion system protein [Pseudobutyrivibrio sp.]|nr:type IV secretion system protein [Pseudobutyrivibrio sp.]
MSMFYNTIILAYPMDNAIEIMQDGGKKDTIPSIGLLDLLYRLAFTLFNKLLGIMQFPHLSDDKQWGGLWNVVKGCFDLLLAFAMPIAVILFIVAIYKAVISKPPEEQPKQFLSEALRFIFIIFIISNLFNFMTCTTQITDSVTDKIMNLDGMNPTNKDHKEYEFDYEKSTIKAAVDKTGKISTETLTKGTVLDFFGEIFSFIFLFFGGIGTILVFAAGAYEIAKVTIERILKPLVMIPFSTILIGFGACEGHSERMISHYGKKVLGFCLSGVFIIVALKMGAVLTTMKLFSSCTPNGIEDSSGLVGAIAGILQANLPVLITTGIVKSADTFMDKIFA